MKKSQYRKGLQGLVKSISLIVVMLVSSFSSMAQERFEEGRQLFENGQLTEARQRFESVMQADPQHAEAAFYLGQIFFVRADYDQAIVWFEKALQINEENSDYHLWLGRGYGHKALSASVWRQFFLARKVRTHFERAVQLNPDNIAARLDLLEYYLKAPAMLGGGMEKALVQASEINKRDAVQGRQANKLIAEAERQEWRAKNE
jgi:tetratricopeptide (TPR) repeat protein